MPRYRLIIRCNFATTKNKKDAEKTDEYLAQLAARAIRCFTKRLKNFSWEFIEVGDGEI